MKRDRIQPKPSVLGQKLREARERLRLSQTVVANFIGTNRQAIAAFEKGTRPPDAVQLVPLSNLFRIGVEELLTPARVRSPDSFSGFLPRLNQRNGLADRDRDELVGFRADLQRRPPKLSHPPVRLPRFATVADHARQWSKTLGLEDEVPVPIFGILARIGVEVRFTSLGGLAGALIVATEGSSSGVLINADQPNERQRFTAAHELGHIVLSHQPRDGAFISELGRTFDPVEMHADQFAAELLIPAHLVTARAAKLSDDSIEVQVYKLASSFLVSFQAMCTRLSKLGAIGPAEAKQLASVRPIDLAKTLGKKTPRERFKDAWIPAVVQRYSSGDGPWGQSQVRLLQEEAYSDYARRVPEFDRADDAGSVYAAVARWVARTHPLVG